MQTRLVTCHRVNTFHWVDPVPTKITGCSSKQKLSNIRTCNLSSCEEEVRWAAGPWSEVRSIYSVLITAIITSCLFQCTWKRCGRKGRQKRPVFCQDKEGNKVRKKLCKEKLPKSVKPKRKRKCYKKQCK